MKVSLGLRFIKGTIDLISNEISKIATQSMENKPKIGLIYPLYLKKSEAHRQIKNTNQLAFISRALQHSNSLTLLEK